MQCHSCRTKGFSLLEILLVMVLVGLMASLLGAGLGKSIAAARMRNVSTDIAAAMRHARSRAILERKQKLIWFNTENKTWRSDSGKEGEIPDEMEFSVLTAESELKSDNEGAIRFYPDGASTGGEVTLKSDGRQWRIMVSWLTGRIRMEATES